MSDTAPAKHPDPRPSRGFLGAVLRMRSLNTFVIAGVLFVGCSVFSPGKYFATPDNLLVFLATEAEFGIIAMAVGILMISGGVDLRVGSVRGFCSPAVLTL